MRYGRPPLSNQALYDSANFSLSILPIRLAHRIQALRSLPFIVVANPHIAQIHNNYMHSLSTLLPYAEKRIKTEHEEDIFTEVMDTLVQTHANTIPVLARGFLEARKYVSPEYVTRFLEEHLRARIGTRLIAEQHIALHNSSRRITQGHPVDERFIGIIDTALRPARVVEQCEAFVSEICELTYGVRPSVIIDGQIDARIVHIPVHLEYILTELLKNAFRATIEKGSENRPIEVTVAPFPKENIVPPEQTSSQICNRNEFEPVSSEKMAPGVTIRIRDRGGGISPECFANLWNYGFTTFSDRQATDAASGSSGVDAFHVMSGTPGGGSKLAGLGYGVPLGRAYAEYFGGGIAIQSLWGWGCDVYLTLQGVEPD
ncbi:MAG: hypothetical protein M1828_002347 [Chrysothrix sp. TS-e1954]|nr:MAG: hypothetical protein M1828_002347 [Chrysothrix sp. TS-e1954]